MTITELRNILNQQTTDTENFAVVINAESGARIDIENADLEFDWDTGYLLLHPKQSVYDKQTYSAPKETSIISRVINGVEIHRCASCKVETSRQYSFCPQCGKRFI